MDFSRIASLIIKTAALSKKDALARFPHYEEEIEYFSERDPSRGRSKYLEWELKILDSNQALSEEIADVVELFEKFSPKLDKRDIYQYKVNEFTELRDKLLELKEQKSLKKDKADKRYKLEEVPDSEKLFENDDFEVLWIKNKAASVFHGKGSKWCVTMKGKSYYEQYQLDNTVFFFILNKKSDISDPLYKIAISYQRDIDNNTKEKIFWSSLDDQISKSTISKYLGESFSKIDTICDQKAKDAPKSALAKFGSGESISQKEQEDLVKNDNEKIKSVIFRSKHITPYMLELLSDDEDPDVILKIAYNHNTPPHIFEKLVGLDIYKVNEAISNNRKTPPNVLSILSKNSKDVIRMNVAYNHNTPSDILEILAKDPKIEVVKAASVNPNTPHEVLVDLYGTGKFSESLAENPNSPQFILEELANDKDSISHFLVSKNPSAPPHLLEEMSKETNFIVIQNVVSNPNTPPHILSDFANSSDEGIRGNLASNPNLPLEISKKLAKDPEPSVRLQLAQNPNTPVEVLDILEKDKSNYVRSDAIKNKKSRTVASILSNSEYRIVDSKESVWDKYLAM